MPKHSNRCKVLVFLLLRTDKLVWTQNETFEGDAQMANFLKEKLKGAVVDWKLEYLNGSVYKDGSFKLDIPNGGITDLGKISIPLTGICQAAKMVLKMEIRNTSFSNNWAIWVYPDKLPEISEKKCNVDQKNGIIELNIICRKEEQYCCLLILLK